MPLTSLETDILTGAVAEMQRHEALTLEEIHSAGDGHQRAKLRIAKRCADDSVVRLNVRDWTEHDVTSGAGRVRVSRSLNRLQSRGYIEKLELYEGSGQTKLLRILPAGLAAAEAFQPAERSA